MPAVRVSDVRVALTTLLHDDVARTALGNRLVSRAEQAQAPADIAAAAQAVRDAKGAGARVTTDELEAELLARALRAIGVVNQPSGPGSSILSRAEAAATGDERVQKAWQIARGGAVDVDAIARAHAVPAALGDDEVFARFATEHEATTFAEPSGKSVRWLVVEGETATTKSYVSGTNDLWSQRFDVDKRTGAVTVTAEH